MEQIQREKLKYEETVRQHYQAREMLLIEIEIMRAEAGLDSTLPAIIASLGQPNSQIAQHAREVSEANDRVHAATETVMQVRARTLLELPRASSDPRLGATWPFRSTDNCSVYSTP
jgi:hypothetical protein